MAMAVPIGMGVLGGAMSVMGGISKANAYRTEAAQYQQQERMAALQAKTDEANRLTQLNQAIGSNHALYAAGNIAVESPTSMALDNANRDLASRSIGYMKLASQVEQQRLAGAAAADITNARWAIAGGIIQGMSSLFTGGMQAGMLDPSVASGGSVVEGASVGTGRGRL